MIDYSKVFFNEKDDSDTPVQYFFTYDLTGDELDKFLAFYVSEDEIPSDIEVTLQELCLTQYSDDDFKLEAIFNGDDGNQYWVTLLPCVRRLDVQELLDKVA